MGNRNCRELGPKLYEVLMLFTCSMVTEAVVAGSGILKTIYPMGWRENLDEKVMEYEEGAGTKGACRCRRGCMQADRRAELRCCEERW